jgi:hypothetical protein
VSDHVVDINDGDLMRTADVQQAVQAWQHGACAGNLDGRPLLHKVVLHVHNDRGGFLGIMGYLTCMASPPGARAPCPLVSVWGMGSLDGKVAASWPTY